MVYSAVDPKYFDEQKALLLSNIGEIGSGAARYSAAMYFYNQGSISPALLEIYRRCCKFDFEDPIKLAKHEGIEVFTEQN